MEKEKDKKGTVYLISQPYPLNQQYILSIYIQQNGQTRSTVHENNSQKLINKNIASLNKYNVWYNIEVRKKVENILFYGFCFCV